MSKLENLSIEQIKLKLKNHELITQEKNKKSEVWQDFLEIVDLNNQYIGYVSCKSCNNIFTYSQKSRTLYLLQHQFNFVCKDLCPFEIIEGESFRDFSQEIINIGAFTTDMWTDNYKKLSYISLTIHFIENWQLKEQILAISKFPNISHIADNIRNTILNILKNYNL
ncbi:10880_t:CDS:2, partial [Gigaspora margarita]